MDLTHLWCGKATTDVAYLRHHLLLVLGVVDVLALYEEAGGEDGRPVRVEVEVEAVGGGEVVVDLVHGPHIVRLRLVQGGLVQQHQVGVAHCVEMPGRKFFFIIFPLDGVHIEG